LEENFYVAGFSATIELRCVTHLYVQSIIEQEKLPGTSE